MAALSAVLDSGILDLSADAVLHNCPDNLCIGSHAVQHRTHLEPAWVLLVGYDMPLGLDI